MSLYNLPDISATYNGKNCKAETRINMGRISQNLNRAQYVLDSQVMTDMVPFMPRITGQFIARTITQSQSIAGTGEVVAAAGPYGRFLYHGKVMVGVTSGSPWAMLGEKKVVTDRNLTFQSPTATPQWFQVAKGRYLQRWIQAAAGVMGE